MQPRIGVCHDQLKISIRFIICVPQHALLSLIGNLSGSGQGGSGTPQDETAELGIQAHGFRGPMYKSVSLGIRVKR